MSNVYCKICNKEFYVKPSQIKYGGGKYCSRKCQFEAQKKGKFIYCDICGKKAWKMPSDLKKSKSGKFFCNKSCQTLWRNKLYSGDRHANWNGGESIYRKILIDSGIAPVCARCGKKDQRIATVHHKDKNRKNNNIKNLVWLCLNCHHLVHRHNESIK